MRPKEASFYVILSHSAWILLSIPQLFLFSHRIDGVRRYVHPLCSNKIFIVITLSGYMHLMLAQKTSGTYATAAKSVRIDGKPVKSDRIYLGKVVDLEKGVFENKE